MAHFKQNNFESVEDITSHLLRIKNGCSINGYELLTPNLYKISQARSRLGSSNLEPLTRSFMVKIFVHPCKM